MRLFRLKLQWSLSILLLWASPGCRLEPEHMPPQPDVPTARAPSSHAPAPAPLAPFTRRRPVVAAPLPSVPDAPAVPELFIGPPESEAGVSAAPTTPRGIPEQPPDPADAAREEATRWLNAANMLEPGCLDAGEPDIDLPSPQALAHLLVRRPPAFGGVAREALVCKLGLPRLTRAEVYGSSAFSGRARSTSINLGGGDKPQGVLVASIHTDNPPGDGTLFLAMDGTDEHWEIRAALYRPWVGDARTRRIASVTSRRLMHYKRQGMVVVQKDRYRKVETHIALTSTERLIQALSVTTRDKSPDTPSTTARMTTSGKGWPRQVLVRTVIASEPPRWESQRLQAQADAPYQSVERSHGLLTLEGAREALEAGHAAEADWLVSKLPKAEQALADAHRIRAESQAERKRWSKANKYWRKAERARDAGPEIARDYGLYLASRKKRRPALKRLRAYLKDNPGAPDGALIQDVITRIQ